MILGSFALLPIAFAASVLDVTTFGAKPDGQTDCTASIQKAIDTCSKSGGGRVLVPAGGVYKTYTLSLKNGVDLHIDRGATLKSGEDPLKFPEFAPTEVWHAERAPRFNRRAMFYTCGQTNVAITGAGTIDGNAEAYHKRVNGRWQRISATNICGRCVFFVGCRDVRFDDVLVYHPCGWSTWFLDCERVQCRGVRVECHREFPNGDGLHFGGCRDVTVSDCLIDAQDDALIVRTHQEQMRAVRPCERMTFANCVLRSNQSAIRIGWTGDGPVRDISFDNIVCSYSRLGVQFFLPKLPEAPAEYMDPPRGRGLVPPSADSLVPFSAENLRFSNLSLNSYFEPICVDIGRTENVAGIRDISFSHCRFTSQRPPHFRCRPEDNVRNWRFSDVTFDITRPRGPVSTDSGIGTGNANGIFENTRDFTFDNVRWSWFPQDLPEWYLTLEQEAMPKPIVVSGARQACEIASPTPGVRRFVYDTITDGLFTWKIRIILEERLTAAGKTYCGKIENNDAGIRVTAFEGPYFDRMRVDKTKSHLYLPLGFGRRVPFPRAKRLSFDTAFYPGAIDNGLTMSWCAFDSGKGTYYCASHDPVAQPKRIRARYSDAEGFAEMAFDYRFFLSNGASWNLPETVFERVRGDWHEAAQRYRGWYDTVRKVRVTTPAWTREIVGWLLVIMRQQNGELNWSYRDLPKLCDIAEQSGLDCLGLFGWTQAGHDHDYPDYIPSEEAGGVAALKAGIAEAKRRGIRVFIYANGQLQHVGATKFWEQYGKNLALIKKDGSRVIQTYHKYRDIPKYEFALGCLCGKPWQERMQTLADQAESFGADGILYDQLGIFQPFACYGKGHGHPTPSFVYGAERPAFIRDIADHIQKRNSDFAVLTEGLHDSILDSVALFHGCQYGSFQQTAGAYWNQGKHEYFPELWRYTFPELVSSVRCPAPIIPRDFANYAATFGFRQDLEVRYAADRRYVLENKVPEKADYGTVVDVPNLYFLHATPPREARAYLKSVCDFQRANAKYLLTGRFVDTEGFTCANPSLVARRFVASDGSSAVCVWNASGTPENPRISGLGNPVAVRAPAGTPTDGPVPIQSLRLYIYK